MTLSCAKSLFTVFGFNHTELSFKFKGKGHGLTITPYAAGHMIGGTMWKIVKDGEEDIIYAVDYNHKKERWGLAFIYVYIFLKHR